MARETTNISALILARNGEELLEDCLKQLDFVDEIILLDQNSEDKTVDIAKKYTKNVIASENDDFSKNRNKLQKAAKGEWLLYIDIDERITLELKEEIKENVKKEEFSAFYFPRRNIVLGKWLKHGGWWPDYVPKLFRAKNLSGWTGSVHESPQVKGEYGYLKNPLTHMTAKSIDVMFEKTIRWAQVEARLAKEANHPKVTQLKILSAALREFTRVYIARGGFRDGLVGLTESIFQGYHRAIVLVYLWELQNEK